MEDFKSKIIEVKEAYDLAEYVINSGISLRANGVGRYKGLCPFHSEKTPSFIVNEAFQSYRCFGCGAHGDLLSFVQEYESLSFFEALTSLAEAKGIAIERKSGEGKSVNYSSLKKIVKASAAFFHKHFKELPESHPAKEEITNRGLSLDKMLYGYAPEGRRALYDFLKKKGFKDEDILLTGVCRSYDNNPSPVDFWNGRLMFFIRDVTGAVIGFSSRKLNENDSGGKYINSPDSPVFNKSKALYNLYNARKPASTSEQIYVTEGQFDVASLVEVGVKNVVASSGTAFTEEQAMMCRRLVKDSGEIIFCFDGDSAGRKAAKKVFSSVPLIHGQAWAIPFPEGKDPCDLRQELGTELFLQYLKKKKTPLVSYVLDCILKEHDTQTEMGRESYVREALKVLRSVTSLTLRDSFLRKVAINSFTPLELLRTSLSNSAEPSFESKQEFTEIELPESENDTEQRLVSSFEEPRFSLPYRMIALLVEEPALKDVYPEEQLLKLIPKELRSTISLLFKEGPYIEEAFPYPILMGAIAAKNYFPLLHLMDSHNREKQFRFIVEELKSLIKELYAERVHRQIAKNLQSSDISVFETALKAEESKMKTFEEKID